MVCVSSFTMFPNYSGVRTFYALFFLKNIVLSADPEYEYSALITAYNISVFGCIWCLDDVQLFLEPVCRH